MTIITNYSRTIKIPVCKTKEQNRLHNYLDSDFDFGFVKSTGLFEKRAPRGLLMVFKGHEHVAKNDVCMSVDQISLKHFLIERLWE